MKFFNSIVITLILIIYALVFIFSNRPVYAALILAPAAMVEHDDETEAETENIEETETEQPYSDDDFYELSHIIQGEAGYCSQDMMIGVGSVVLNRVASDKFPNTIYEVVNSPGQYTCNKNNTPTEQVNEVTDFLLRNGSQYPSNVLYQANFPQGTGIYLTLSTNYSTMYFCYG